MKEVSHPKVVASEEGARRWSWPRRRKQRHFRFGKKVNLTYICNDKNSPLHFFTSVLGTIPKLNVSGEMEAVVL